MKVDFPPKKKKKKCVGFILQEGHCKLGGFKR